LARRCELLLGAGADAVVVAGPDEHGDGANDLVPVAQSLRDGLGAETAFVACPPEPAGPLRWPALRPAMARAGIEVVELPRHRDRQGRVITAALIAEELSAGRIDVVTEVLGRPHRLSGVAEIGDQRGRTIGFPTANIPLDHSQVWPALGVYAARVQAASRTYPAAVNIGVRPTIYGPDGAPLLEAHLLDFEGDLYGQVLVIDLIERLRAEHRFDGIDGLVAQLRSDVARARTVLADTP
jgi:riboflavin kinase/FMN adenylyltransferase